MFLIKKSLMELKAPVKINRFPETVQEYPVGLKVCMLVIPDTMTILLHV